MISKDQGGADRESVKPSKTVMDEFRDLDVKSGAADVKGGRPVKKGGDPEDGGE